LDATNEQRTPRTFMEAQEATIEARLLAFEQHQTLQTGMAELSQELGKPVSHDLKANEQGVYRGYRMIGDQPFGLIEQNRGFKLIEARLCQDLVRDAVIQSRLDEQQRLRIDRIESMEPTKLMEKILQEPPPPQKVKILEKDHEIDF